MLELIMIGAAGASMYAGYKGARNYVRDRLRYVDAIQRLRTPLFAGLVSAIVAAPVVAMLPVLGTGTALLFGAAVGWGVARGARDVRGSGREVMIV